MTSDNDSGSGRAGPHTTTPLPEIDLWERYLAGETTPAEEERLHNSGVASGACGVSAEDVRALARSQLAGGAGPTADPQQMLRALETRLGIRRTPVRRLPPLSSPLARYRTAMAAAACAAIVAVVAVTQVARAASSPRSVRLGAEDTGTYRAGAGERLHLRLAEGLDVGTAPGGAVRVTGVGGHREVYVTGEAYVDDHDTALRAPTIHAGNAVLRSVRARFTVRTDTDAQEVRIAVAGGVVMLGDSGAPWSAAQLLAHDNVGVVSATGITRVFRTTEPDAAMLWEAGTARLGRDGLRDVLPGQG